MQMCVVVSTHFPLKTMLWELNQNQNSDIVSGRINNELDVDEKLRKTRFRWWFNTDGSCSDTIKNIKNHVSRSDPILTADQG